MITNRWQCQTRVLALVIALCLSIGIETSRQADGILRASGAASFGTPAALALPLPYRISNALADSSESRIGACLWLYGITLLSIAGAAAALGQLDRTRKATTPRISLAVSRQDQPCRDAIEQSLPDRHGSSVDSLTWDHPYSAVPG